MDTYLWKQTINWIVIYWDSTVSRIESRRCWRFFCMASTEPILRKGLIFYSCRCKSTLSNRIIFFGVYAKDIPAQQAVLHSFNYFTDFANWGCRRTLHHSHRVINMMVGKRQEIPRFQNPNPNIQKRIAL
jgi:hypothetical protein